MDALRLRRSEATLTENGSILVAFVAIATISFVFGFGVGLLF